VGGDLRKTDSTIRAFGGESESDVVAQVRMRSASLLVARAAIVAEAGAIDRGCNLFQLRTALITLIA
jgi:hypothetical protein